MAEASTESRGLEFDTDLRLYDVRWDACDVTSDFPDARLTLGYCLGLESDDTAHSSSSAETEHKTEEQEEEEDDDNDDHLLVLDRFDVIAGIADDNDATGTRPDITEDCPYSLDNTSNIDTDTVPDITDICDIVVELEDSCEVKPDIVDVSDVNLCEIEDKPAVKSEPGVCEGRPDVVENAACGCLQLESAVVTEDVSHQSSDSPDVEDAGVDVVKTVMEVKDMLSCHPDVLDSGVIVGTTAMEVEDMFQGPPDVLDTGVDVATTAMEVENVSSGPPDVVDTGDIATTAEEVVDPPDVVDTGDVTTTTVEIGDIEVYSDDETRPGSVGHLLKLVRALANNLGTDSETPSASVSGASASGVGGGGGVGNNGGGNTNLGFEDTEHLGREGPSEERNQVSSSGEDVDWSWLTDDTPGRPPSWLRASMRRVRRFALGDPQESRTRCSAPDILDSVPPPPPPSRPPEDFPRRYSHLGRRPEDTPEQPSEPNTEDETNSDYDEPEETKDWWPHSLSSLLASLGCTLGLFNVSRFAILSVHFGANFVIQFLFLSVVVGWPLYTLNASLGQHLKAGVVDMWRISPLFQGIGIALLLAQAMLGLYSVVGVAWMFTYFRDSFINKYDAYRWAENGTRVEESVPDYLNTVVLQRQGSSSVGHLKFQVTFNLAVVWMIVFVCLSKGIKSYGKSVYFFAAVPIFGISILAIKVLTLTDIWFDHTAWNELFVNSNCWTAAAIECVMTWGLLGAATMQMRSHSACCRLSRECLAVGAITLATLVSAALLANGFAQLLWTSNLRYVPSSFEHSAVFLSPVGAPRLSSTPVRWMPHGHHVVGLQVSLPGTPVDSVSGYQAAQFATELAPAVFAKLGPQAVSPFWTVLFYFTLILLGLSQQLCIWHCVITGIMAINITRLRSWETTITFLSCSCGFVLGLPMTTELGIVVVYFMDYCVGGAWWLILLQAAQIIAALMAQGGEAVAHTLLGSRRSCLQAFVVFTWNVVLPLALTVVSVTWFRSNHYRDLYSNRYHGYWPAWARRLGCFLQLIPLVLVPVVAAIQTWRYLTKGPNDLFDRLRLLCRPGPGDSLANQTTPTVSPPSQPLPELAPVDDPPPKYTPPPSYSTATGARIAKMLRRSFRRLVAPSVPSPPDYSAVLVEMGGSETAGRTSTLSAVEVAHILRSSMRRTLRREQVRSDPSPTHDSSKTDPVI